MTLRTIPWKLRATGVLVLLALTGAERPGSRPGYSGRGPSAHTAQRPSYEITVESLPEWAEGIDEMDTADLDTWDAEPVRTAPSRSPARVRPTARQVGSGDYHEANFRGRVHQRPEPVWHETMPERVIVRPTGETVIYEGPSVVVTDPLYSEGAAIAEVDGLSQQVMEPVEVLDGEYPSAGCDSPDCYSGDGSICDLVYRNKGCHRPPCPCPTDEVLTYYRCNHYGYYPTFWRPWPDGWLKYRPEYKDTIYDRYRKTSTDESGMGPGSDRQQSDLDLDRELQDMLRSSPVPPRGQVPGGPPPRRRPPELLPEETGVEPPRDPAAPRSPPPKLDQSNSTSPRRFSLGNLFGQKHPSQSAGDPRIRPASYESHGATSGRAPRVTRRGPSRTDF